MTRSSHTGDVDDAFACCCTGCSTPSALWVAAYFLTGLDFNGTSSSSLMVAAVFGLVNSLLRPLLTVLTCPLIVLTLGLFTLVINALMLHGHRLAVRRAGTRLHGGRLLAGVLGRPGGRAREPGALAADSRTGD